MCKLYMVMNGTVVVEVVVVAVHMVMNVVVWEVITVMTMKYE